MCLCGVVPPTQEVCCIIVVECCDVAFGVVEAVLAALLTSDCLPVVSQNFFGEWVSLSNWMVLLWVCPGLSLPAYIASEHI